MKQDKQKDRDFVNPQELIALEQELAELKQQHGLLGKPRWWVRLGDWLAEKTQEPRRVDRKKYIRLALTCGWFCGAHRFYARQKSLGTLYLLLFWTGFSFTMTLIDLMIVVPMKADSQGMIEL